MALNDRLRTFYRARRDMTSVSAEVTPVPIHRWRFLIDPAYSWFGDFASNFHSPDVSFWEENEDDKPPVYWMASLHLSEVREPEAVRDRACALKSILDGALHLGVGSMFGEFHPFTFRELWSQNEENAMDKPHNSGFRHPNLVVEPFCSDWAQWMGKWKSHGSPFSHFESAMLWMARVDETTRGMLQFLGANGVTWISLYGLVDFMRTAGKTPADIAGMASASKAKVDLFLRTANNFAAIGPFCRHGDLGNEPPKVPMMLEEARVLVFLAAKAFLTERLNQSGVRATYEAERKRQR